MTSDLGTSPDGDAIVKAPLWRWGLFFALFFALGVGVTQTSVSATREAIAFMDRVCSNVSDSPEVSN